MPRGGDSEATIGQANGVMQVIEEGMVEHTYHLWRWPESNPEELRARALEKQSIVPRCTHELLVFGWPAVGAIPCETRVRIERTKCWA